MRFFSVFSLLILFLCTNLFAQKSIWNATLLTDTTANIPFIIEIDSSLNTLHVINGEEKINVKNLQITEDSLKFEMPVFGSQIKAAIKVNTLAQRIGRRVVNIEGFWYKYPNRTDYVMPFSAYEIDMANWNRVAERKPSNINGKWEVTFTNPDGSTYPAIGEFKQNGHNVSGTFITKTGDYRYLNGKIYDKTFYLSCFDGAHAFFFRGDVKGDEIIGEFYAGKSWREDFVATKNSDAKLPDAYGLTFLKEGYEKVDFSFPDFNNPNTEVTLADDRFKDKAVVIQILGTWCPNCMDETDLYSRLSNTYKDKDVEFVAVAFERYEELAKNQIAIDKYKNHFNLSYPVLFGGKASKTIASEKFPMLNEIISFPTTIILDKEHNVTKIHTGFAGPATSEYNKFVDDFIMLLDKVSE